MVNVTSEIKAPPAPFLSGMTDIPFLSQITDDPHAIDVPKNRPLPTPAVFLGKQRNPKDRGRQLLLPQPTPHLVRD
jgi:hypothetical protein